MPSLSRLTAFLLLGTALVAQDLTIHNWSAGQWTVSHWTRGNPETAWEQAPPAPLPKDQPQIFKVDGPREHAFHITDGIGDRPAGCLIRVVRERKDEPAAARLEVEPGDPANPGVDMDKAVKHALAVMAEPPLAVHITALRFYPEGRPPAPAAPVRPTRRRRESSRVEEPPKAFRRLLPPAESKETKESVLQ